MFFKNLFKNNLQKNKEIYDVYLQSKTSKSLDTIDNLCQNIPMIQVVTLNVARMNILAFNVDKKTNFILNGYINGLLNSGKSGALFRLPSGYTFSDASIFYMQYNDGTAPISLSISNGTDLVFPVLKSGEIRVWGISL